MPPGDAAARGGGGDSRPRRSPARWRPGARLPAATRLFCDASGGGRGSAAVAQSEQGTKPKAKEEKLDLKPPRGALDYPSVHDPKRRANPKPGPNPEPNPNRNPDLNPNPKDMMLQNWLFGKMRRAAGPTPSSSTTRR